MTKPKTKRIKAFAVVAPNGNLDCVQDIYESKMSAEMLRRSRNYGLVRGDKYRVLPCTITYKIK